MAQRHVQGLTSRALSPTAASLISSKALSGGHSDHRHMRGAAWRLSQSLTHPSPRSLLGDRLMPARWLARSLGDAPRHKAACLCLFCSSLRPCGGQWAECAVQEVRGLC